MADTINSPSNIPPGTTAQEPIVTSDDEDEITAPPPTISSPHEKECSDELSTEQPENTDCESFSESDDLVPKCQRTSNERQSPVRPCAEQPLRECDIPILSVEYVSERDIPIPSIEYVRPEDRYSPPLDRTDATEEQPVRKKQKQPARKRQLIRRKTGKTDIWPKCTLRPRQSKSVITP